jgi:hypothetical protein
MSRLNSWASLYLCHWPTTRQAAVELAVAVVELRPCELVVFKLREAHKKNYSKTWHKHTPKRCNLEFFLFRSSCVWEGIKIRDEPNTKQKSGFASWTLNMYEPAKIVRPISNRLARWQKSGSRLFAFQFFALTKIFAKVARLSVKNAKMTTVLFSQ